MNMLISAPLSIRVTETLFDRSGKVLVLKQELMFLRDSTRKLLAVLISFGGIWSSPMALFMLMRFINFGMSVVVSLQKEKNISLVQSVF